MTLLGLTGLLNFLTSAAMAVVVYLKCPQRAVARTYGLVNLTVAFFSAFYVVWQRALDPASALLPMQMLTCGAMWINQAFLLFIFTFLGMTRIHRQTLWLTAALNLIFSVMNFTGGLYVGLEPRYGFGFWPVITRWFPVYLIFWHAELFYGFAELMKGLKHAQGRLRDQLGYMVVAFAKQSFFQLQLSSWRSCRLA